MIIATAASASEKLTTLAFGLLRADILSGRLLPKERLRAQSLAQRYDIGATAIREALYRLTGSGLVESQDQRGFSVAPVSREELIDLTRARIDIESLALRRAITHGGIEWESDILKCFHRLSKTPLPVTPDLYPDWTIAHRAFHDALVAAYKSPITMQICSLLRDKMERYANLSYKNMLGEKPRTRDTLAEHEKLMKAALARDAAAGEALIAEHFQLTADIAMKGSFDVAAGASR